MGIILNQNDGSPRALQELARHEMIHKLYADILADMMVCEIEGWDKLEYIHQLQDLLNSLTKEAKNGECITVGEVPRWIPVTERLPKKPAQVLVTYSWGEVTVGEYWNNGEGWGTYGEEVLAWMPLPEPYKEGAEHGTD